MLELFRRNHFLNILVLFAYIAVLRFSFLMEDSSIPQNYEHQSVIWDLLLPTLKSSKFFNYFLGVILIFFQATYLNRLVIKNQMTKDNSMFPGVFYIILHCSFPEFLFTSPILIGMTFLLFAIDNIFKTYRMDSAADYVFNAAFWISVASLFYFPFILFQLFTGVGLLSIKSIRWHERFQLLIGMIVPYFLIETIFFLQNKPWMIWDEYILSNLGIILPPFYSDWQAVIAGIFFFILIGVCILGYNRIATNSGIHVKKKVDILFIFLLFCLPTALFIKHPVLSAFLTTSVTLGFGLGSLFLNIKSKQVAEVIHLIMLALILVSQFYF